MKGSRHRMTQRICAIGLSVLGMSALAFAQYSGKPAVEMVDLGKPVSSEVQKANIEVVNQFLATIKIKDLAKAESLLADNVTWRIAQTRPMAQALMGKDAVLAQLKALEARGDVDFEVLRSVTLGPIVLNERNDHFPATLAMEGRPAAPARTIRVHAGMFFVNGGKIVEWTDYRLQGAAQKNTASAGAVDMGKPVTPEEQKANLEVVRQFNATWRSKDIAKAASLLADNMARRVSQRTALAAAIVGRDPVAAFMKGEMDSGDIDFRDYGEYVTLGPVVLVAKDDLLPGRGGASGRWIRIHAAMFFVQDGKIMEWTDYRLQ